VTYLQLSTRIDDLQGRVVQGIAGDIEISQLLEGVQQTNGHCAHIGNGQVGQLGNELEK